VSTLRDSISFRKVTFRYDSGSDPALVDVSFDIPAGKITALVGASGAGKTTIVNLLLRLYSATEGNIRIDGRAIEDIRRTDWLGLIAIAGQDVDLVEGTVIENIRMAKNDASEEEVLHALRVAGISELVEALPDKYDTWVGQHGLHFSGGQRQRLGLARAIVRNPQFLILDEAMSALDRALEESVKRAIQLQFKGRTLLLITHRLESVLDADHVVCIEDGRVCAEGFPARLLADPNSMLSRSLGRWRPSEEALDASSSNRK
jgi:ABC-type multidrug transport system fused ATPase/permease subunit